MCKCNPGFDGDTCTIGNVTTVTTITADLVHLHKLLCIVVGLLSKFDMSSDIVFSCVSSWPDVEWIHL